jgi:hypothetical protein
MTRQRISVGCAALLGAALFLAPSCGAGSEVVIENERALPAGADEAVVDATSAQRFGYTKKPEVHGPGDGHNHEAEAASGYVWTAPEGWLEMETSEFRQVNMQPAGDPELQCYMSVVRGSLMDNLNRWRGQFGLGDLTQAEIDELPDALLFALPAKVVDLDGNFTGMGGEPQANTGMLGMIMPAAQVTVTVKMTGPAAKVAAQTENFYAFCASLGWGETSTPPASSQESSGGGELTFSMPESWSEAPPKSMRSINLMAAANTQCYLIILGGEAGGLLDNLNRWRGEVDLGPMTDAAVAELPTLTMLGREVSLLEVSGNYQGMGGEGAEDQTVLGVCWIDDTSSMFMKMVGPSSEVADQKENFIAFISSLKN